MNKTLKIAMASDHAGFDLRAKLKKHLENWGHEVIDLGPDSKDAVDYPDYAKEVALKVQSKEVDRGILTCGSGVGMSIAANRYNGVRAVLPYDKNIAKLCREHNDSNVVCFGERTQDHDLIVELLKIWIETEFDGGRHQNRVGKIDSNCVKVL